MVSEGLNEVSTAAIEEVGDTPDLNFERNRRRYRLGMGFGIEAHENGSFVFMKVFGVVDA